MLQNLLGFRGSASSFKPAPSIQTVTAPELYQRLLDKEPLLLIDVRSPEEYRDEGHIRGARLLPLAVLSQRSNELTKDHPIICICRSGRRSQVACEQLVSQGFGNVTHLVGGMIGWRQAGLPIE